MSRIPESFIEEVLARVDLVALIDRRVPLKKKGREFTACCPFHQEKSPSFFVNPDKQFYHCFGCGAHGNALKFLMEYEHQDFRGAIETLAAETGLTVPEDPKAAAEHDARVGLYAVMNAAQTHFAQALRTTPAAIDYLKNRGVTGETAARFGLGFAAGQNSLIRAVEQNPGTRATTLAATFADWETVGLIGRRDDGSLYERFRQRLMIPIRDRRGQVIGFGGRVIGAGEPKYLNSPENPLFHKSSVLFGLYEARQANARPESLLIVEGYLDVIMLAQHGIAHAVATMGTATTPEHINLLFRHTQRLVFCFDGDTAGHRAAAKALHTVLPQLEDGRSVRFLFLPDKEDPDSFVKAQGANAFLARIETHALGIERYFLHLIDQQIPGKDDAAQAAKSKLGKEWLATMPAGDLRILIEHRLKEHTGVWRRPFFNKNAPASNLPPAPKTPPKMRTAESLVLAIVLRYPELATSAVNAADWPTGAVPPLLAQLSRHPPEHWANQAWYHEAHRAIEDAQHTPPAGIDSLAQAQSVLLDTLHQQRHSVQHADQRAAAKAALLGLKPRPE